MKRIVLLAMALVFVAASVSASPRHQPHMRPIVPQKLGDAYCPGRQISCDAGCQTAHDACSNYNHCIHDMIIVDSPQCDACDDAQTSCSTSCQSQGCYGQN